MSQLSSTTAAEVAAACRACAADTAEALGRALDGAFTFGEPTEAPYADGKGVQMEEPGLLVMLTFGGAGLAVALPESLGLLPAWYGTPDATGQSKLATLAQELSMLVVPETLAADGFEARRVPSIVAALRAAQPASDASTVSLPAGKSGLCLVWPLAAPKAAFETPASVAAPAAQPPSPAKPTAAAPTAAPAPAAAASRPGPTLAALPHYARSLLKIKIPVSVQLASKKETVQEIVEIVPGSIIKFEKGCDEVLQMVVGGQMVAEGEAVKIGDKFGFRVTSMLMPREHFVRATRQRSA